MKIAIIGAGLAGLTIATLFDNHHQIEIFEKARGVGGRMAQRRRAEFSFDHGAQYFTIRDDRFKKFLEQHCPQSFAPWDARFVSFENGKINRSSDWQQNHFVGIPGMNGIIKTLAQKFTIHTTTKITTLKHEQKWQLTCDDNQIYRHFDLVILTAPASQTSALLPKNCNFKAKIEQIKMLGCYTLMLGFAENPLKDFDAGHILDDNLSWVSVNSSKPQRTGPTSIVINSTNRWAEQHMEDDINKVQNQLYTYADELLNFPATPQHIDTQRWRYANISSQNGPKAFFDQELKLGACGDWCIKGRVEAAFLSALSLYEQINTHWM